MKDLQICFSEDGLVSSKVMSVFQSAICDQPDEADIFLMDEEIEKKKKERSFSEVQVPSRLIEEIQNRLNVVNQCQSDVQCNIRDILARYSVFPKEYTGSDSSLP